MTLDLDAIEARVAALAVVAPGPWRVLGDWDEESQQWPIFDADHCAVNGQHGERQAADFIAAARTDVPALIARVRELEADLGGFERRAKKAGTRVLEIEFELAVCKAHLEKHRPWSEAYSRDVADLSNDASELLERAEKAEARVTELEAKLARATWDTIEACIAKARLVRGHDKPDTTGGFETGVDNVISELEDMQIDQDRMDGLEKQGR